jgi:hypothetical protein
MFIPPFSLCRFGAATASGKPIEAQAECPRAFTDHSGTIIMRVHEFLDPKDAQGCIPILFGMNIAACNCPIT